MTVDATVFVEIVLSELELEGQGLYLAIPIIVPN
jgi:hypothetical protein